MKILVTGGAGFIGCHMVERLLDAGHFVVVVDNLSLGHLKNLASVEDRANYRFVEADIADRNCADALLGEGGYDAVVHLAANSDIARSFAAPANDFTDTFATTFSVLEAMRSHGVRHIVFASTSAIYGEVVGMVAEDHGPLLPISHYGAAKLASEAFISSYAASYGIQAWMPRFPNVVGDRLTHGAIFDFVGRLCVAPDRLEVLGNGKQVKPYLHVDDLVDAILLGWSRFDAPVNIFNVGGITRCNVARMAEIVVEEWGRPATIVYTGGDRGWVGDVPSVDFDTSRIRALGWEPKLSSEAAVRAAARWAVEASAR